MPATGAKPETGETAALCVRSFPSDAGVDKKAVHPATRDHQTTDFSMDSVVLSVRRLYVASKRNKGEVPEEFKTKM
jgi:hypothetical protein